MTELSVNLKLFYCCQVENRVYFLNITFNGLFYLDIEDFSVHFVHKFSFEYENAKNLTAISLFYEDALYFFPNSTNVIMKYDIIKQQEESIPIQNYNRKIFVTASIIRRHNLVYMFPADLGYGVYVFNLRTQIVAKDKELSLLFESGSFGSDAFLIDDNCALISIYGTNRFIEINLDTKQIICTKTLNDDIDLYSVCYDGNSYWILSRRSTDIYEWNIENDALQVYKNENAVWEEPRYRPYSTMIFLEDEILVLNGSLRNILRVNKEKKTIEDPIIMPEGYHLVNDNLNTFNIHNCYTVLEDKVLFYPCRGNMLLIYDKETKSISGKELRVSEKEIFYMREVLQEDFMGKEICVENEYLDTLDGFLRIAETNQSDNKRSAAQNIGKLIFKQTIN